MEDVAQLDLGALLGKLTLEEKVSILAATDWWRTPVIKRDDVFVPHIKTTDGPNGARGESYVSGIKAACFPCGASLGASFDCDLVYRAGKESALETKSKAASVLLAPTLNIIRSPRGGRNYETYSEDPVVLGKLAAAFVNGCQSEGIAATPKHYVANDTEDNRMVLSAQIDEQTLREIYMRPFQMVMKLSDPWCFMTCYNKVNGTYVSDSEHLVNGVLRKEWGFTGTVVSDWMGVYSTAESINAGVDLEMPGPTRFRADKLVKAVHDGLVSQETIDTSAMRVLKLARHLGRFDNPEEPPEIEAVNDERDRFIQRSGAEGMVLLRNEEGILPVAKSASIALIGHHALYPSLGGGGSARVDAIRSVSPAEGLEAAGFKNVVVKPGVPVYGALPHADASLIYDASTGTQNSLPVQLEWFNSASIGESLVYEERKALPEYMIKEKWPEYLDKEYCTRMTYTVVPTITGNHVLSVITTGRAECYIDGQHVYSRPQETDLKPESFYFFKSQLERRFTYHMVAGRQYKLVLESWNTVPEILYAKPLYGKMFQGSALRFQEHVDTVQRLDDAVDAARNAEVAVVCVGTNIEIESEGFDRTTMELSGEQVKQILAVSSANPKTVVVNFSGGPVDLSPFAHKVPGLVQAWFPGQECGHSLAMVLSGDVNPSGRLPFTWPRKDEDNPTWNNFPCDENMIVRYEEGLDVGYRFYDREDTPAPLFPFGFGLSYTEFALSDFHAVKDTLRWAHDAAFLSINVSNVGAVSGAAVVQFYVEMPTKNQACSGGKRPIKELKEFEKVTISAGESRKVDVSLDKDAFSVYCPEEKCWQVVAGRYKVHAAFSTADIRDTVEIIVPNSFKWTGV